ncbi:MAG: cell division protein FtsE, partial [Rhodobacteraceae bacterium]|nr:cell division protein FtsE [Paracoccaceae bacterium]
MIEMKSAAYSYGDELLSELNISISQGSFYFLTG